MTGINFVSGELRRSGWNCCASSSPLRSCGGARKSGRFASRRSTLRDLETAARTIGLQIHVLKASTASEIDAAFAAIVRAAVRGACSSAAIRFSPAGAMQLVALAARHAIPGNLRRANLPKPAG